MIPERKQTPGRIIRTGWTAAGGIDAANPGISQHQLRTADLLFDQGTPPHRRRTPIGPRLRTSIAVITVIGLLGVILPWLLLRHDGPEDVARAYLDAVISGDTNTVLRHLSPVGGTLDTAINGAIHQATAGGISDYVIDWVDLHGTRAEVAVTLRNSREQHRTVLRLHAATAGPFSPVVWELAPIELPILSISPLTGTDSILLNGQSLEIPEVLFSERGANRMGVVLHVLPGSYVIELPPPQPPLTARTRVIYVPPVLGQWQTGLIDIDYGLSPSAEARVRSVIRSEIARCAESTSPRPAGCPFAVDLPEGTVGSWTVTRQPEIEYAHMLGDSFQFRGENLEVEFTITPHAAHTPHAPQPARAPAPPEDSPSPSKPPGTSASPSVPEPSPSWAPSESLAPPIVVPVGAAATQQEARPGSVFVTSVLFGASIHRVDGGYELAAWSYAGSRPRPR